MAELEAEVSALKAQEEAREGERGEAAAAHAAELARVREEVEGKAAVARAGVEAQQGAAVEEERKRVRALEGECAGLRTANELLQVQGEERARAVADLQQGRLELEAKVADLGGSLALERREAARLKAALEREAGKGKAAAAAVEALKGEKHALEEERHKLQTEVRRAGEAAAEAKKALEENAAGKTLLSVSECMLCLQHAVAPPALLPSCIHVHADTPIRPSHTPYCPHERTTTHPALAAAESQGAEVEELRTRLGEAEGEGARKGKEVERLVQRLAEQDGATAALVAEKNEHRRRGEELAQQLEGAKRCGRACVGLVASGRGFLPSFLPLFRVCT